jgi:hypothetical protein
LFLNVKKGRRKKKEAGEKIFSFYKKKKIGARNKGGKNRNPGNGLFR